VNTALPALRLILTTTMLAACAPVAPPMTGGSTTLAGRQDLSFGAAARIPLGEDAPALGRRRAGLSPLGALRLGLPRGWDLGLIVAGPSGRLELRHETELRAGSTRVALLYGVSGWAGHWEDDAGGRGWRAGAQLPAVVGVDIGGLYEAWGGFVMSFETLDDARWLRGGALLGLAMGLRWLHFWVELTIERERALGHHVGPRARWVLGPSFGFRVRL